MRSASLLFVLSLSVACGGAASPPRPTSPTTQATPVEVPGPEPIPAPDEPRRAEPASPQAPPPPQAPPTVKPPPKPKARTPLPWSAVSNTCQTDRDCVISCEGACCSETCGCTIAVNGASLQAWRDSGATRDCAGVTCRVMGCDYQPASGAACVAGTCRPTMGVTGY